MIIENYRIQLFFVKLFDVSSYTYVSYVFILYRTRSDWAIGVTKNIAADHKILYIAFSLFFVCCFQFDPDIIRDIYIFILL